MLSSERHRSPSLIMSSLPFSLDSVGEMDEHLAVCFDLLK